MTTVWIGDPGELVTIRTWIVGSCARWSKISSLGKGRTKKPSVSETKKKKESLDLTRRGNSNVLAHCLIIQVLTDSDILFERLSPCYYYYSQPLRQLGPAV